MTVTASFFISLVIVAFLIWVVTLIKQRKLAIKFALYWVILPTVLLIMVWFPKFFSLLANLLGIHSETNMIFFVGFCFSLWIIFWLTNTVSLQASKIKKLTQEIALANKEKEDGKREYVKE